MSVVLRLASALYQGSSIEPLPGVTDQVSYHELAVRVLNGHGFSFGTGWWPATRPNAPTAHWSFLYVLFLAAIYSVCGTAPLAARLIQAVIVGSLQPLLAWRVGTRLFGSSVGLVSAAFTALYGYFVFYAGALVTESLYFVAFLWVVDTATALGATSHAKRRNPGAWISLGVSFSLAVLLRQVFLLMVPFVLAWVAWRAFRADRQGRGVCRPGALLARLAIAVAVLALAIAPWTVRNYRAFGRFVLLNTNAGFAFFWGNHPVHGDHFIPIVPNDMAVNYRTMLPRELRHLNEAELDRELLRRGFRFVRDDPGRYVRLSASRALEYFKFWPSAQSSRISNYARVLSYGLFVPLFIAGAWITLRPAHWQHTASPSAVLLLLLLAVCYSGVHLLTWTLVRYRLPLDAITMPFAAAGAVFVWRRVRAPASAPALAASGVTLTEHGSHSASETRT